MSRDASRRDFLSRFLVDPASEDRPSSDAGVDPRNASLPKVISWLNTSRATPYRTNKGSPSTRLPILRPPGAIDEDAFLKACTRCDACLDVCPHDAIEHAPAQFRELQGTPRIDPSRSPCRLCDDLPCIAACEPQALRLDGRVMGVARVSPVDCLNALGTECRICIEQCPVPGAIGMAGKIPLVQKSLCTGCGVCHFACPAPENAIAIMPNPARFTSEVRNG